MTDRSSSKKMLIVWPSQVVVVQQNDRIASACAILRELVSPILQRLFRNKALFSHEAGDAATPGGIFMAQVFSSILSTRS